MCTTRLHGRARHACSTILVSFAVVLVAGAIAPASSLAGQQDVASTRVYLRAVYELERTNLARISQLQSAAKAFSAQLAATCPDALKNVEARLHMETSSARAFGEQALHQEQLQLLEEELQAAGRDALNVPSQPAFLAFETAVATLPWESTALRTAIAEWLHDEHAELFSAQPAVCQDIGAWAASGYRLLSPGTRAFLTAQQSQQKQLSAERTAAIGPALKRFEISEGRMLASKIEQVTNSYELALTNVYETLEAARTAIGLQPQLGPKQRRRLHQLEHVTQLGGGRTDAGDRFRVSVVPASGHCAFGIEVLDTGGSLSKQVTCASHAHATVQHVRCEESERIVEATMPANVRKVALLLSGGRILTSRTITIPAHLGGPVAFYYQAVPRGAHVPVSITELDADGRPLVSLALESADRCVRFRLHPISHGPHLLAHGQIPGGPSFTIKGDAFAFNGPPSLSLSVELEGRGGGGSGLGGSHPKVLEFTTYDGCYPVDFHIVYGILKAPADTIVAHADGKTEPLEQAKLPGSLHSQGVLVYGVFTSTIESIVVSTPGGQDVDVESLSQATLKQHEYCEGFIEQGREPSDEGTLF